MKKNKKLKLYPSQIKNVCVLSLICFFLVGCLYRTTTPHATNLIGLDFTPESGNYNITATGEPLNYSDVKFYSLAVQLDAPAPGPFTITYGIFGDEFWSDPILGKVDVTFDANTTSPSQISYSSSGDNTRTPTGAPGTTSGKFWLGCTAKKIIRGNAGKGHDSHAPVYLERMNTEFHSDEIYTIGGSQGGRISVAHNVTCL